MKYLLLLLLIGCTKSTLIPKTDGNILYSNKLIVNLDSTVLSITLMPYLHCYSLKENKPCIILVEATITLSKPIQKWISLELVRDSLGFKSSIGIVLPKNVTIIIFNTSFLLQTNIIAPQDIFRIEHVHLFNLIH